MRTDKPNGRVNQPAIPGLAPPFHAPAALEVIELAERRVSVAEQMWEEAAAHAKELKKSVEDATEELRQLIRDFREHRLAAEGPPRDEKPEDEPDADLEPGDKSDDDEEADDDSPDASDE